MVAPCDAWVFGRISLPMVTRQAVPRQGPEFQGAPFRGVVRELGDADGTAILW